MKKIPFIFVTCVKNKYDIQKEQEKAGSWLISIADCQEVSVLEKLMESLCLLLELNLEGFS